MERRLAAAALELGPADGIVRRPAHTEFNAGLRTTIDWYRDNEKWWRPLKDAVEAEHVAQGQ